VVFPAATRFLQRLQVATNLVGQPTKFSCFSPGFGAALYDNPWRRRAGVPVGSRLRDDGVPNFGIVVAEVPIGDSAFRESFLEKKGDAVVSYVQKTVNELRNVSPFDAWSTLNLCCQTKLDYLLRLLLPVDSDDLAAKVDNALGNAATALGLDLTDPYVYARFELPARLRGGGVRERVWLRLAAYCASFVEACQSFFGTAAVPPLQRVFGDPDPFTSGVRFTHLVASLRQPPGFLPHGSESVEAFVDSWDVLQRFVANSQVRGALDADVTVAGSVAGGSRRLQRALTAHVEQVKRDTLHADFQQLPPTDPRREAWFSCDVHTSTAFVRGHATHDFDYSAPEFAEVFAQYFGLPAPCASGLVGLGVPCSQLPGGRRLDAYAVQLGLANLPGGAHTACHDACADFFFEEVCHRAGLKVDVEPRWLFNSVLPVVALLALDRPGVVPDGTLDVALPALLPRGQFVRGRKQPPLPSRVLLFDVKCVFAGGPVYRSARARDEQCGGVEQRAWEVHLDYERHARRLDLTHSPVHASTRVLTRLQSFTATRGLVFGQYGECSSDVHTLVDLASDRLAAASWRLLGSRTQEEARGVYVARLRRRLGLFVTREFARHRLRRVLFAGCDRQLLSRRRDRVLAAGNREPQAGAGFSLADFAALQVRLAPPV
jgi:hypothetical protein